MKKKNIILHSAILLSITGGIIACDSNRNNKKAPPATDSSAPMDLSHLDNPKTEASMADPSVTFAETQSPPNGVAAEASKNKLSLAQSELEKAQINVTTIRTRISQLEAIKIKDPNSFTTEFSEEISKLKKDLTKAELEFKVASSKVAKIIEEQNLKNTPSEADHVEAVGQMNSSIEELSKRIAAAKTFQPQSGPEQLISKYQQKINELEERRDKLIKERQSKTAQSKLSIQHQNNSIELAETQLRILKLLTDPIHDTPYEMELDSLYSEESVQIAAEHFSSLKLQEHNLTKSIENTEKALASLRAVSESNQAISKIIQERIQQLAKVLESQSQSLVKISKKISNLTRTAPQVDEGQTMDLGALINGVPRIRLIRLTQVKLSITTESPNATSQLKFTAPEKKRITEPSPKQVGPSRSQLISQMRDLESQRATALQKCTDATVRLEKYRVLLEKHQLYRTGDTSTIQPYEEKLLLGISQNTDDIAKANQLIESLQKKINKVKDQLEPLAN